MDPKSPPGRYKSAPPSSSATTAMEMPGEYRVTPRVDDHLVTPETRQEVVRGRTMLALPANLPHGKRHCELDYVIRGNVADGYVSATDLLTRAGPGSNFATDTCILKEGTDPRTNTRWLEELAFEVVAEQSLRDITERAQELTSRGVRRLVAIFVHAGEVREWSAEQAQWRTLGPDEDITDPTLRRPIRVRALLDAAEADNAVARGLKANNNPVIAEFEEASRQQGMEEALASLRRSVALVCTRLNIPMDDEHRDRLAALDPVQLESLLDHLLTERRWP